MASIQICNSTGDKSDHNCLLFARRTNTWIRKNFHLVDTFAQYTRFVSIPSAIGLLWNCPKAYLTEQKRHIIKVRATNHLESDQCVALWECLKLELQMLFSCEQLDCFWSSNRLSTMETYSVVFKMTVAPLSAASTMIFIFYHNPCTATRTYCLVTLGLTCSVCFLCQQQVRWILHFFTTPVLWLQLRILLH